MDPVQFRNRTFTFFGLDIQESETNMDYDDDDNDKEVVFLPSTLSEAIQGERILQFYLVATTTYANYCEPVSANQLCQLN